MAQTMARRMITNFNDANVKTWREAAREGSRSREIFEVLHAEIMGSSNVAIAVRNRIQENANLIVTLPLNVSKEVTKFVGTKAYEGLRSTETAKILHGKISEYTRARATLIARTETSKAMTALTEARSLDNGIQWYIWRTANDGLRVRESHRLMKDVLCRFRDPPNPEGLNGEKDVGHYNAGNIYNCFKGSTDVNFSNGCHKLWRSFYDGVIVNLIFFDGTCLEATSNHPILTDKGWLPINMIKKNDNIIKTFRQRSNILDNYKDISITSFQDLFDSLGRICTIESTMGSKLDFHGDGSKNNVNIISPNRLLTDYFMSDFFKCFTNFDFSGTNVNHSEIIFSGNGFLKKSIDRIFSTHGIISLANNFFSFLDSKLGHSNKISFTPISSGDMTILKNFCNGAASTRIGMRQTEFTFSVAISRDYFILWQAILPLIMRIFGYDNTPTAESIVKSVTSARNGFSNIGKCGTILYETCKVVDISISNFIGHVYNLQSNVSWYSITQDNYIVHNCRCFPRSVISIDTITFPATVYYNGQIVTMTKGQFLTIK